MWGAEMKESQISVTKSSVTSPLNKTEWQFLLWRIWRCFHPFDKNKTNKKVPFWYILPKVAYFSDVFLKHISTFQRQINCYLEKLITDDKSNFLVAWKKSINICSNAQVFELYNVYLPCF